MNATFIGLQLAYFIAELKYPCIYRMMHHQIPIIISEHLQNNLMRSQVVKAESRS